jgi:hypothetical protein
MPLTPKRQRFVLEYMVDLNATQADLRAGYAKSGARTEGARLLANADVQTAIAERTTALAEKAEVSPEWVLTQLRNVVDNPAARDADRIRASELIGKHLGMFTERVHHTASFVRPELAAIPADQLARLQELAFPGSTTGEPSIEAAVSRLLPAIDGKARVLDRPSARRASQARRQRP